MGSRRVGIKDVAAAAGVSMTTVSHILNDAQGKRINPDTRERVRTIARELGYTPDPLARGLRTRRSQTIGMISDEIPTTPFAGKIILGVQDVAKEHDSVLILMNSRADPALEEREARLLLQRRVDGVLHAAMYHRRVCPPPALGGAAVVLLNAFCDDPGVSWVVPDEEVGGRDAAEILLLAGHRSLGHVNSVDDIPAQRLRRKGFTATVRRHGAGASVRTAEGPPTAEGGYRAAIALLGAADRPTGVFCFNDQMAAGAYRAASELGLVIPDDVSMVGFDNLEIVLDCLFPGLTTIALPHYEMGAWAAAELYRRIDAPAGKPPLAVHQKLRGRVVHRASVAPPPRT